MGKTRGFRAFESAEKERSDEEIRQASFEIARAQAILAQAFREILDGDEVAEIGRLIIQAGKTLKEAKRAIGYKLAEGQAREARTLAEKARTLYHARVSAEKERYEQGIAEAFKNR